LGAALAERCERVLDGRLMHIQRSRMGWHPQIPPNALFLVQADLEARAGELYALAGEIAAKLEGK
jgi:hypothetical protein